MKNLYARFTLLILFISSYLLLIYLPKKYNLSIFLSITTFILLIVIIISFYSSKYKDIHNKNVKLNKKIENKTPFYYISIWIKKNLIQNIVIFLIALSPMYLARTGIIPFGLNLILIYGIILTLLGIYLIIAIKNNYSIIVDSPGYKLWESRNVNPKGFSYVGAITALILGIALIISYFILS